EQIAYSAHSMNFRAGCGFLQLAPQVVHVHRNSIRFELLVDAVELVFENALRYDAALAAEQVLQNRSFTTRKLQRNAGNADVSTNGIEDDIAGLKGGTERRSRTAQQSLRPSNEFAHRKRLHEIVVCARIEAKNTLLHRIACGQDQNRYAVSSRPQFSKQVQSVPVGKPEVEDRGIVGGVCQRFPRIGPQPHGVHGKLGALKRGFDDFRNPRLIFDDQKTHVLAFLDFRLNLATARLLQRHAKFKTVLSRLGSCTYAHFIQNLSK